MAKAKKSTSEGDDAKPAKKKTKEKETPAASAKKASAAGPAAKAKKAAKAGAGAAAPASPMIDTTLAAQNAAAMLAAGLKKPGGAPANQANAGKSESAMFKQLKAGLNKPHSTTMSNLLEKSQGPNLTQSHQAFNKQVGHNQTYGADVTRSGVPRRTPG